MSDHVRAMVPTVKTVVAVETIRDGGSLAATFCDDGGAKWILFLRLDRAVHESRTEPGFQEPVLIDADPGKRPVDTERIVHSELSGPAYALSWEHAQRLVEEFDAAAPALDDWAAKALDKLRTAVKSRGVP